MRIDGAGGCFDNRIYEINNKSAWNLLLLTVNEMGVTVDSRDDENGILECHNDKKVMRFSAQAMDEETTQVFADVHGKRIQVYNWKPQDKEVNLFYDLFENKLREYRAFILCIWFIFNNHKLDSAGNFTGTQATSANINAFYRFVNNSPYLLNVRFPSTFSMSIGMADVIASESTFAADFANGCHESHLLNVLRALVTNLTKVSYHRL